MEKYSKFIKYNEGVGGSLKSGDIKESIFLKKLQIGTFEEFTDIQNNNYNLQLQFNQWQLETIQNLISNLRDKFYIHKDDQELQSKIKAYILSLAQWDINNLKLDTDGVFQFKDITFTPNDDYSDMDITFKTLLEGISHTVNYKDFPIEFINSLQHEINMIMNPTYITDGIKMNNEIETIASNHDTILTKK